MPLFTSSDKALWRLALPMIFSNITVPLLGLVDTAVIGHLDSPVFLGGVAVGATATSFLFMLLLFLRMSTTGLTAQAFGAKNPQALARALIQPLLLALGAGVMIVLFRTPLIELALHIVGGNDAVLVQARRFLEIRWLLPRVTGESGAARLAVRRSVCAGAGYLVGRGQYPQYRARPVAGDGASYERAGCCPGDGHRRICHVTDRPHDGT